MVCRIKRGFAQTRALAEQVGAATMMLDSELYWNRYAIR